VHSPSQSGAAWIVLLALALGSGCGSAFEDTGDPRGSDDDSSAVTDDDSLPSDDDASGDDDATAVPGLDDDGDGISNTDEGEADPDGDGVPNSLDTDSDGDGIDDADEAGDNDTETPPADSDEDGTPDFLDLDSDGNGILDSAEGGGDADGDGTPDANDLDNDGDGIDDVAEIGGDPANPRDSDGDGTDDWLDLDSDGDGQLDSVEGGDDLDGDGVPNYLDDDSDGDGLDDATESATDTDGDGRPGFLDADSDNDGILDAADPNRENRDTDGDGFTDLAEETIGTSPTNASSHPGDDVFYAELQARHEEDVVVPFTPEIRYGDVLFLLDTTCSMTSTLNNVADQFADIVAEAAAVIPDLTFGVSSFNDYDYSNYGSSGDKPFWLKQQQTTSTTSVQNALSMLNAFGGNDSPEASMEALYQASTGYGWDLDCDNNYDASVDVPPFRASASDAYGGGASAIYNPGVPGTGNLGGSGFRNGAVPIMVLATDAQMRDSDSGSVPPACSAPAGFGDTTAAMNTIGAKFIGIGTTSSPLSRMRDIANATGSIADTDGDGAADDTLVFQTSAGNVVERVVDGIVALTNSVVYDLSVVVDDPSGYGFVTAIDPEVYYDSPAGVPVEFTLTVSTNVVPAESDQVFLLGLTVLGNGAAVLAEMTLLLVVLGI